MSEAERLAKIVEDALAAHRSDAMVLDGRYYRSETHDAYDAALADLVALAARAETAEAERDHLNATREDFFARCVARSTDLNARVERLQAALTRGIEALVQQAECSCLSERRCRRCYTIESLRAALSAEGQE